MSKQEEKKKEEKKDEVKEILDNRNLTRDERISGAVAKNQELREKEARERGIPVQSAPTNILEAYAEQVDADIEKENEKK